MENLTLEQCSRIFERLGIFKTVDGVKSLVQMNYLLTEPADPNDRRYSKYGFRISTDSFITYLQGMGFTLDEIVSAISPAN